MLSTKMSSAGLKMMRNQFTRPSVSISPLCTMKRYITTIPQPPGGIVGTVNDAYVPPQPVKSAGSLHWTAERGVSVAIIPLTLMPLVTGAEYGIADAILSSLLLVHSHIGFQSCIMDYIPKRVYGVWHNYAMYLLSFGGLVSAYGIYEIESKEKEGLVGLIKKLWTA